MNNELQFMPYLLVVASLSRWVLDTPIIFLICPFRPIVLERARSLTKYSSNVLDTTVLTRVNVSYKLTPQYSEVLGFNHEIWRAPNGACGLNLIGRNCQSYTYYRQKSLYTRVTENGRNWKHDPYW